MGSIVCLIRKYSAGQQGLYVMCMGLGMLIQIVAFDLYQ